MNHLRVVYVHGISSSIINYDYSYTLTRLIVKNLKKLGIIGKHASQEEVDKIITFENVNYSSIGHREEDKVLGAYIKDSNRQFNVFDKIWEKLVFYNLRKQLITSVSDVLVYESNYWREHIRNTVKEKIDPYVGTGDSVTLIAHSLGSVVSFDTLYYNCRNNLKWENCGFKVTNLFTLGSPIALFSLELEDKTGTQKFRYKFDFEYNENGNIKFIPDLFRDDLINKNGVWYNFYDAQDLIGYPLESLFDGKFPLKDFLIQTGTFPLTAHNNYWKNKKVAETISKRLAIDYDNMIKNS